MDADETHRRPRSSEFICDQKDDRPEGCPAGRSSAKLGSLIRAHERSEDRSDGSCESRTSLRRDDCRIGSRTAFTCTGGRFRGNRFSRGVAEDRRPPPEPTRRSLPAAHGWPLRDRRQTLQRFGSYSGPVARFGRLPTRPVCVGGSPFSSDRVWCARPLPLRPGRLHKRGPPGVHPGDRVMLRASLMSALSSVFQFRVRNIHQPNEKIPRFFNPARV